MRKRKSSKRLSFLVSMMLMVQVLFPALNVFAAETNNNVLPPSNLSYQLLTPTDVKLTWSSVFGATGYKVYEITDGQLIERGTMTTTSFTINGLPEGSYTYVVSTLSPDGESGPCAPITVNITYPDMTAPTLTYTIQNGNDIVLSWTTSAYAQSYNLYQVQADGQRTLIKSQATHTYTVVNAPMGTATYAVSAANSAFGESPLSAPVDVNVVLPVMAAPGNFTFSLANVNDINLKWNAVSYATNYKIYQIQADGQKVLKSTVTGTTVSFTNQEAGEYVYEVYSYSSRFGESAEGSRLTVTVGDVTMTAPGNLTYKLQNVNDVVLTWSTVSNATGYKIYQLIDGQLVLKSTVTGTAVTYTNQPAGDYHYEVHSYSDRFGESAEGSQVSVTLSSVTMEPPAAVNYTLKNVNDVVLTWETSANASSYKVYQIIDGQKVLKSTVTGTTVTYTNQPQGNYTYEVHSFSTRFGESAEGSQVSVTLSSVTMEPPAAVNYTLKNVNDVVLTWETSANASSYKVYQIINGQKVLKSTVTGTTVTYTNQPQGNYTYEVHSFSTRFGESAEGTQVSFTLIFPTMEPPANLIQTIKNATDFSLTWAASDYATSYKVYQIVDGQKVLKSTVSGLTVTYTGMPPGDYTYEVHSVSTRFGESSEGSRITVTLSGQTLQAPTNPTYTITNGNDITLKWTAANYATSYRIYQIIDGQKVLKSTATGSSVIYRDQPEGTLVYEINSVSTIFGESPEAAEVTISLIYPTLAAPGNLAYKIQNGNDVVLTWGAVTYANSYKVYELVDGQKVLKNTVTSLTATQTKVQEGDHTYIVKAVSSRFGESPEGGQVTLTILPSIMQAPGNFTKSIVNGNDISLKWNTATYATAYNLYKVVDGQEVLVRSQTGTAVTLTNQPEGEYNFVVRSYSDRFGESAEGSELSFTLVWPVMQAPSGFKQSITNGNDITLRWDATTYASGYKLYQVIDGQEVLKKTQTGTAVTFTNQPEGDYAYVVRSYSDRFGESAEGGELQFTLTWPVVQPPVLAGAVFNANNITLSWQSVTWANEYHVYDVTGGDRQLIYKGTALSYKVYNLSEESHSYEVTAYSTRFGESAPSNRVSKTIVFPVMQPPVASINLLSDTSARISWNFVTYANGYNIYELIDGKPVLLTQNLNNLSFTVSDLSYKDHEYYVTSYSNSFGESEPSNTVIAKLIIDTEAPVTKAEAPAGWTNLSQIISLSATDNETGVANTFYSLNDGEYTAGASVTVDKEGVNKVSFYSVDKVGNTEAPQTIYVKIDQTLPNTKVSDIPEWIKQTDVLTLTATDNLSGIAKTFYSINGSDYNEGNSITVDNEGINKISYYSVDQAGNKEAAHTVEVKLDKTAPVTTADAPAAWTKGDVTVQLTAADTLSGVAKTFYSIDGSAYVKGSTFTVSDEGIHKVAFYSTDMAGNIEAANKVEVKIDRTAPVVTMDLSKEAEAGATLQLNYSATDALSGVVSEKMTVSSPDGAAEQVVTNGSEIVFDKPGVYTVTVTVTDGVGLSTTLQKQFTVYLPASITVTPNIIKGNKGVFTVRVDLPNGYNSQGFDLNTATVNGVKALNSNNGYYQQAKLGQFKFERSDFDWTGSEVTLHFRGYVNGILVIGEKVVKIQK
ncbi:fibronectin type III domain-containing protein [Paenibacillus durus]|uniref:Fibronectin type-III domain-containing protein n=1 Tax=Paenibacillus durus TaxID=44251 RepID=A0A089HVL3_PAEDU|nr:fibronectin type III domain-containing protein [Paenibacillus durus]AIQ15137.1 hypothetical protein PDUR_27180 [Paenibacillus durus]